MDDSSGSTNYKIECKFEDDDDEKGLKALSREKNSVNSVALSQCPQPSITRVHHSR